MSLILSGTDGLSDVDGSAATPAIRGTDTNTGIYFPGADRIGFSEGGVQVGEFDASGNFLMNSGYGSAAVAYGCRAWVNFNGTGTVAIRASGNVSSITDNGVGNYTLNFTNALVDTNYCAVNYVRSDGTNTSYYYGATSNSSDTKTTSAFQISTRYTSSGGGSGVYDSPEIGIAIFR
jgi:hypothetical protein